MTLDPSTSSCKMTVEVDASDLHITTYVPPAVPHPRRP